MPSEIETLRLALRSESLSQDTLRLCLSHEDWRVRHAAIESVRLRGGRAEDIQLLLEGLRSADDVSLRNAVAQALAELGPKTQIQVMNALSTLDADARKLALEIVATCPDAQGVECLLAHIEDPDPNVAICAIEGLAQAALADVASQQKASSVLVELLGAPHPLPKYAAALSALAALGPPLPDALLDRFASEDALATLLFFALEGSVSPRAVQFAVTQLTNSTRAAHAVKFLAGCVTRGHAQTVHDSVGKREGARALNLYASTSADPHALLVLAACGDTSVIGRVCVSSLVEHPAAIEALGLFGDASVRALLVEFRTSERLDVLSTLMRLEAFVGEANLPMLNEVVADRVKRLCFDDATEQLMQLLTRSWKGHASEECPFPLDVQQTLLGDTALDTLGATLADLVWAMPSLQRSSALSSRLIPLRRLAQLDAESCFRADDACVRARGALHAPLPASLDLLRILLLDEDEEVAVAAAERLVAAGEVERVETVLHTHSRRVVRRRLLRVLGRFALRRVLVPAALEQLDVLELHALAEACAPLTDVHASLVEHILARSEAPLLCATLQWIAPSASSDLVAAALPLLDAPDASVRLAAMQVLSRVEGFRSRVRAQSAAAASPEERAGGQASLRLPRLGVLPPL